MQQYDYEDIVFKCLTMFNFGPLGVCRVLGSVDFECEKLSWK